MAALIGMFIGAIVGKLVFGDWAAALLAIVGFIAGAMLFRRRDRERFRKPAADAQPLAPPTVTAHAVAAMTIDQRIAALEHRVAELERNAGVAPLAEAPPLTARVDAAVETPSTKQPVAPAGVAPRELAAPLSVDGTTPATAPAAIAEPHSAEAPVAAARPPNPLWAWIVGGNTLARVGALLLLIGVGFLLKYASEHVSVPIEMRLAAVAAGAIALLVVGWRLRERRSAYAMILQGAGVGVLYLTVFAAMKLYALIPPLAAFVLLFWIAALSSWLAIRQDAIALAALGVLGGFAAPVLTSTSAGSHVMLFSYYALLNAAIFFIAWFKAWRALNLLGFVCTFVVGALWGVTRYRPEDFATTEPFLVLFFLFYVGIAVLYALRRSMTVADYVDGTIVFGTPLVAAALQHALVRDIEYAMAASAIVASALYLSLGTWLYRRHRDDLRLLVESFLALGVVFATLAVPLALDARWTSATWALEGAALVWIGMRQAHRAPRWFGVALQFAAGCAFALDQHPGLPAGAWPILNSQFVGAALVGLAGFVTARLYQSHPDAIEPAERAAAPLVFAWGLLWWLGAAAREIHDFVAPSTRVSAGVGYLAANAVLFAGVSRRLRWALAGVPVALTLPALVAIAIVGALLMSAIGSSGDHLFAHGGAIAWPFAIVVTFALLRWYDRPDRGIDANVLAWAHALALWLVVVVGTHEIAWAADDLIGSSDVWPLAAWGLAPALALADVTALASGSRWPIGANRRAYLVIGATPIAAWLVLWSLVANTTSDGNAAPLPYVPLFNPLDLTQAFALTALLMWTLRLRAEGVDLRARLSREVVVGIQAVLLFVWINAIALRTVHHVIGIDYAFDPMWRSPLVQAVLSLLWTVCALATMVWANRRSERAGWIAGAALLGVVVAKLFLVDLSRAGTIERIVSFIGVGLLLLLIGYLAPVPARREQP